MPTSNYSNKAGVSLEIDPSFYLERGVLIGAAGQLGKFLQPHLPVKELKAFDVQSLRTSDVTRRLIRNLLRSHICADKQLTGNSRLSQIVVLAVPETEFTTVLAATHGRRSDLLSLLGISGTGFSRTVIVYVNSVHANAAKMLEPFAGPAFGFHALFRPGPDLLMKEQTAVITYSERKSKHHLFGQAFEMVQHIAKHSGIGRVVTMTPDEHDTAMSDIQFLSHSLFLTLGDFFSGFANLPSDHLVTRIREGVKRIVAGTPHVYFGIALGNPKNSSVFNEWRNRVLEIPPGDILEVTSAVVSATEDISHAIVNRLGRNYRAELSTPVSRMRDVLIDLAKSKRKELVIGTTFLSAIGSYSNALTSPDAYEEYFNRLKTSYI